MARMTEAQRTKLSHEWLNFWRFASRPVIEVSTLTFCKGYEDRLAATFEERAIFIEHSGAFAQHRYGRAALLRVSAGGMTITDLVCPLVGLRANSFGLVAIRSGLGLMPDIEFLAVRMQEMHIEAARRCLDANALVRFTSEEARKVREEIEKTVIRAEMPSGDSTTKKSAALRL